MSSSCMSQSLYSLKIAALTVGDHLQIASTQYRLGQFAEALESEGIALEFFPAHQWKKWPDFLNYDLVIVQKRLLKLSLVRRIRKAAKRMIYDTDDAIWEPHGRKHSWWTRVRTNARLKAVVKAADICTVPNRHLADVLEKDARQVKLIPMALDETVWFPAAQRANGPIRIGWAGAPPNLLYLTKLSEVLHGIQERHPEIEVVIYCGEKPEWPHPVKMTYHPYTPGTEAEVVRTFDIGLLPLPEDAFAAGKSPIKALQYAACGIPCVAAPVGATQEIVQDGVTGLTAQTPSQWEEALERLIADASERQRLGNAAREMFEKNHTRSQVQARLVECWKQTING